MENIDMNNFITLVGNFGFPLILAVYLLIRFEKKIDDLTLAVNNLIDAIKNKQ